MAEGKFEDITSCALRRVIAGSSPEDGWVETLRERYSAAMLVSQVKHSCPKWAFCVLCHVGHVRGVRPGGSPASESRSSAAYTLKALDLLLADPSLAENKRELKRRVFGEPGTSEYRTPNDEVEVLLTLWESGAIEDRVSV